VTAYRFRSDGYRRRLDNLVARAKDLSFDEELLAHWSRYLAVLMSGYLEVAIGELCLQHVETRSHPNIRNYVYADVRESLRNPKFGRVADLLGKFDSSFSEGLRKAVSPETIEAIDGIVDAKNHIAHGEDHGVTMGTVRRWLTSCDVMVEAVRQIIGS
jgi:hypothetical protein